MSDDLNFNIKMHQGPPAKNAFSNDLKSSGTGYTLNSPPQGGRAGYQLPSSQNDPESSHNEGDENVSLFDIRKAGHPVASLFTFLFKLVGIFGYLFLGLATSDNTLIFIIVILAAAADFWTVKNITGRLLVGLRWWSEIQADGTEKWHFESHNQAVKLHPIDKRVFWWSQTIAGLFWAVISLLNLLALRLYWGTCSAICLTLSIVNYWGYYKCSQDHQKKLNNLLKDAAWGGFSKGFGFFKLPS